MGTGGSETARPDATQPRLPFVTHRYLGTGCGAPGRATMSNVETVDGCRVSGAVSVTSVSPRGHRTKHHIHSSKDQQEMQGTENIERREERGRHPAYDRLEVVYCALLLAPISPYS